MRKLERNGPFMNIHTFFKTECKLGIQSLEGAKCRVGDRMFSALLMFLGLNVRYLRLCLLYFP